MAALAMQSPARTLFIVWAIAVGLLPSAASADSVISNTDLECTGTSNTKHLRTRVEYTKDVTDTGSVSMMQDNDGKRYIDVTLPGGAAVAITNDHRWRATEVEYYGSTKTEDGTFQYRARLNRSNGTYFSETQEFDDRGELYSVYTDRGVCTKAAAPKF